MDTLQLSYLLTLSKEKYNITKAAKKLYITQAALSKSVHNMENKLGVQLFLRENGRLIDLSPAGKVFMEYAKQILNIYDDMCSEISLFSGELSGSVKIGIPSDIVNVLFYRSLPNLILNYPSINMDLFGGSTLELENKFKANQLDIMISLDNGEIDTNEYEISLLASQPYGVILDSNHPLASHASLTWKELGDYPLALPTRSYTRMLVLNKFMSEKIKPNVAINVFSTQMLVCSVQHSQMITILPRILYQANANAYSSLSWIPIEKPIHWNLVILMRKRHRDLNDAICRIFDDIKKIDLSTKLDPL